MVDSVLERSVRLAGGMAPPVQDIAVEAPAVPRAASAGDYSVSRRGALVFCILGLVVSLCLWGYKLFTLAGVHDFTGFVIGARLVGSNPWDLHANLALQRELTGAVNDGVIYMRPPFFAAAVKPFLLLSYPAALAAFKLLMVACLAAFAWLFPLAPRRYTALAVCWSAPAIFALTRANDVPLVLLLITASLVLWRRGYAVLAGVALALCLAKFHFLAFLPFVLLRRPHRRVFAGFAATAAALIALSFAVQPDWIPLYWRALHLTANINARPNLMPNFYAAFHWTHHAGVAVIAGALVVGALLWLLSSRLPFDVAMPACILGGVIAAPHANLLDGLLALPALLAIAQRFPALGLACALLLSPPVALAYGDSLPAAGPLVFVAGCVWVMGRAAIGFRTRTG